ncbi:tryptophan 2,3-dioxygenase [Nocardia pseudobrasiliensis]|uniref:tryptophan 2,3-dioxygenase n=1 Tax=Nocardia pseudobrasiliensis TaxID=45979 RepID=UPI0014714EEC|nr:tryptophan 2,3-dioxygenase family protein [Nocardia pseudobrasiliensis]
MSTDASERTCDMYLQLDRLLSCQRTVSGSDHEMLFIVAHQSTELWLKLLLHELRIAMIRLRGNEFREASHRIGRCGTVLHHMTEAWEVLSTLCTNEFLPMRPELGTASGLQSYQYRQVEFMLGAKHRGIIAAYRHNPTAQADLIRALKEPGLYDAAIDRLSARGFAIAQWHLHRDVCLPYQSNETVANAWRLIYENPREYSDLWELGEGLTGLEQRFQQWRIHHLQAVARIIGYRHGTGGTDGLPYLRHVLDNMFFPELWEIRTTLGVVP